MAFNPDVAKLSTEDFLKKLNSPMVDIYVGKKRKHYAVPSDLLRHHSGFFSSRLSGIYEGEEIDQKTVYLLDEEADDFAWLVDFAFRGVSVVSLPDDGDPKAKMARCKTFIGLAMRLEMTHAAAAIHPVLKEIFTSSQTSAKYLQRDFIELVYDSLPKGHIIRSLVVQAALPELFKEKGGRFGVLLETRDDFAADVWRETRLAGAKYSLILPLDLSKTLRKF